MPRAQGAVTGDVPLDGFVLAMTVRRAADRLSDVLALHSGENQ
jgi:hypothetical protein